MKNLRTFTCIAASLICALALTSLPVMAKDRVSQYDFDSDGKVSFDDINRYCTVSRNLFNHADYIEIAMRKLGFALRSEA